MLMRLATIALFLIVLTALPLQAQVSLNCSSTYKPDEHDPHGETCPYETGECSYLASASVDSYTRAGGTSGPITQLSLKINSGNYYNIVTQANLGPFTRSASSLALQGFIIPGALVGQAQPLQVSGGTFPYDNATKIVTVPTNLIVQ